eukprot:CAMPEP_0198419440 /NCGR_PEP_ID=MMETSP1452-20131203/215_1 /TAXON_ID=1181717 /ORGANISM="Synchroma pusillum, Strain CCMP3072" /LENGTH=144 /DNA_ID=CAMNT_0044139567 /DNA_START=69 /DNA_END=503 /DNA_ORIENTATION=+
MAPQGSEAVDTAAKIYTEEDVASHNTREDCWIIISTEGEDVPGVYDVTQYLDEHPGGGETILDHAGADATDMFEDIGHSGSARETLKTLRIGSLKVDPAKADEIRRRREEAQALAAKRGGLSLWAVAALIAAILAGVVAMQFRQ